MAANSYSPVRIKQLIVHQHKKLPPLGNRVKTTFSFLTMNFPQKYAQPNILKMSGITLSLS